MLHVSVQFMFMWSEVYLFLAAALCVLLPPAERPLIVSCQVAYCRNVPFVQDRVNIYTLS